ncbi:DEAD/DEAH box helicase [Candidatus Venteria ishoeyi]|uniref:ATP-dependent helicase HepA n=1 Tax=Candidatus Venteria ishoeyi TaxID=1899563 RepID=A0A1H6FDW0_9GAMM|nr:SNF2-related protein [Candidatus Venteria ishoeyi]SEH08270.1 ATP-dependent helicase HepA [Candidatus Venteria ishoeyi]
MSTFSKQDIRKNIPTAAYSRGNDYWIRRRVVTLQTEFTTRGELKINATVLGSGGKRYHQTILAEYSLQQGFLFNASCTCPVGYRCKHIAAVLLKAIEDGKNVLDPNLIKQRKPKIKNKKLQSNSEQNIPVAEKQLPTSVSQWFQDLVEHAENPDDNHYPQRIKHRLLYLLSLEHKQNNSTQLSVQLVTTRQLKDGGYGTSSPFRGNEPAYLRPIDKSLIRQLNIYVRQHTYDFNELYYDLQGEGSAELLQALVATGRCHWNSKNNPPLTLGEPRPASPQWQVGADGHQSFVCKMQAENDVLLPLTPPCYVDTEHALCGLLETQVPDGLMQSLLNAPTLLPEQAVKLNQLFSKQLPDLPAPRPLDEVREEKSKPVFCLHLSSQNLELEYIYRWQHAFESIDIPIFALSFQYGQLNVPYNARQQTTALNFYDEKNGVLTRYLRDTQAEKQALKQLYNEGLISLSLYTQQHSLRLPQDSQQHLTCYQEYLDPDAPENPQLALDFSLETVPRLRAGGWQITMDADYHYQVVDPELIQDWYAEIDEGSGIDWFGLELGINIDGERTNLLPLLVEMLHGIQSTGDLQGLLELDDDTLLTMRLEDGRILPIPLGRVKNILSTLVELLDKEPLDEEGRLRMMTLQAAQLVELEAAMGAAQLRWLGGERLLDLGKKLQDFKGIQTVEIPKDFQTELRPYQHEGVNWLQFLREYQLAGILADDMGLGKTVQTLAHILIEKRAGRLENPVLVVAPTSLMANWRMESERFAPDLKVLTLHGPERKQHFEQINNYDLVLTTYPLLPRDKEALMQSHYHILVLDEAQNIKNPKAKATQLVHQIKADHRLCLTGTPMENHLGELWSLFHFLIPGLLGDPYSFRQLFRGPIERDGDPTRSKILSRRIAPFMLRRTKEEVVKELPEKTEIIRKVEISNQQRDLYETIRLTMHDKVRQEVANKGMARSQIIILDALLKLRQICCDPRLLKLAAAAEVKQSAKLELLMEMLPEMIEEGPQNSVVLPVHQHVGFD